ncbi:hypothetical protein GCM10009872_04700 [Actinopolymorpha rutila]
MVTALVAATGAVAAVAVVADAVAGATAAVAGPAAVTSPATTKLATALNAVRVRTGGNPMLSSSCRADDRHDA